jgi:hypothetical protein
MKDSIKITIKDAGIDKVFIIKKSKGMATMDFFMDINSIIARSNGPYAPIAQQFMHNCMQTGFSGIAPNKEVADVISTHSKELMHFIFNTFFRELTKTDRDNLLEQILPFVIFLNGTMETALTISKNHSTAEHIDLYVDDMQTIFKICQEFIKLTYPHFLPAGVTISSQEDLNKK